MAKTRHFCAAKAALQVGQFAGLFAPVYKRNSSR
jgi:hypothetical protein